MILSPWKKIIALMLVISLIFLEIGLAQPLPVSELLQGIQPEKKAEETAELSSEKEDAFFMPSSLNFLESGSPLSKVSQDSEDKAVVENVRENSKSENRYEVRTDRMRFDEALEEFRSEYAAAVILDSISADNLRVLAKQSFETALIVIHGEIVLFSTGNKHEIGYTDPVRQLMDQAVFISHVHTEEGAEGPSEFDLKEAVESPRTEYVVTAEGAYEYNRAEVANGGKSYSYQYFIDALLAARFQSLQGQRTMEIQRRSREALNQFITGMDAYNTSLDKDRLTFRRGDFVDEVLTYDAAGNVSVRQKTTYNDLGKITSYETVSYLNTIRASRGYYEYDAQGRWTLNQFDRYYAGGNLQSRTESRFLEGLRVGYGVEDYYLDGRLKAKDATSYWAGLGTSKEREYITYDSAGVVTQKARQGYTPTGLTSFYDDTRYENSKALIRWYYEYDSQGRWSTTMEERYYSNGTVSSRISARYEAGNMIEHKSESYSDKGIPKSKDITEYWPGGGSKTRKVRMESYDEVGRLTRIADLIYDELGKIKVYDDLRFTADLRTIRWYYEYDALGRFTLQQEDRYDASGRLQSVTASRSLDGKKLWDRVDTYKTDGVLKRVQLFRMDSSSGKMSEYLDYNYEDPSSPWFYHYRYDMSGSMIGRTTVEVLSPLKTNQPAYAMTYRIDGQVYSQNHTLVEGENTIGRLNAVNLTVEIPVILKTSDFRLELTQLVPARTASKVITVNYGAGILEKSKDLNLLEGPNRFVLTDTDSNGYAAALQIDVVLDTTPPRIVLLSTVPEKTRDAALSVVYTADQVEKTKTFTLVEGANTVSFSEKDDLGNEMIKSWTVTLDSTPPTIVLTAAVPELTRLADWVVKYTADGVTKEKSIHLSEGSNRFEIREIDALGNEALKEFSVVLDSLAPEILVLDVLPAKTQAAQWTVRYKADGIEKHKVFNLAEGANLLELIAEDAAGNRTVKTLVMEKDTTPPALLVTSVVPVRTKEKNLTVFYTVDGAALTKPVVLTEGANTITLSASDELGNQALKVLNVVLDTQAPEIIVTSPLPQKTNQTRILARYTVDGISKEKGFDLAEGLNTLELRAEDEAGNAAVKILDLIRDTVPPQIVVTTSIPARTREPDFTVTYTVDGMVHEKIFSLSEGVNTLTLHDQDEVGNESTKTLIVTLDTTAPLLAHFSVLPERTRQAEWVLRYTADGTDREKVFTLKEGVNELSLIEADDLGNAVTKTFSVLLDRQGPVLEWAGPVPQKAEASLMLRYRVDGQVQEKLWEFSGQPGEREIEIIETDDLGNSSSLNARIQFDPPSYDRTLADGTVQSFENRVLRLERFTNGSRIFYDEGGRIKTYQSADRQEFRYLGETGAVQIVSAEGAVLETLDVLVKPELTESELIKTQLESGLSVYYRQGQPVLIDMPQGVKIYDFEFNEDGSFSRALLVHPDGRLEAVRQGSLIRSRTSEGLSQDFLPDGRLVRDIAADVASWYFYQKDLSGHVNETKVILNAAESVSYGADGLLSELKKNGEEYAYLRYETEESIQVLLDGDNTLNPEERIPVEFNYSPDGVLNRIEYSDGSAVVFEQGALKQYTDAGGNQADYQALMKDGLLQGVSVRRNGADFVYSAEGFLQEIETDEGKIIRQTATALSDEDVVQILLETAGGDRLSDFELDSEGRIMKGILKTKEGVKQTIENGVLTGFETVDGKIYGVRDTSHGSEAYLKEWNMLGGSKVVYGGGTIASILLADGRRLDKIGLNAQKTIQTYTETLLDGTQKDFEEGRLRRLTTPAGLELNYNREGLLESVRLRDGDERAVSYSRNQAGEILDIHVTGNSSRHVFSADGKLKSLLTGGVRAELDQGGIKSLETLFGTVESPALTFEGIASGQVRYGDGVVQTIDNGLMISEVRADGTRVSYSSGRVASLDFPLTGDSQGQNRHYAFEYVQNVEGVIVDIRVLYNTLLGEANQSLIQFLLKNAQTSSSQDADQISRILFSRPLEDWTNDRSLWESSFSTGDSLQFTAAASDAERGTVFTFGQDYQPAWQGVVRGDSYVNDGLITHNVLLVVHDNLPAQTASFTDINGDGLLDRVYNDEDHFSDYWWVQMNNGNGFEVPVKWSGVNRTYSQNSYYAFYANQGTQRFYHGRKPTVVGDFLDLNGDQLPDRVVKRLDGSSEWLVQWNNGSGFDAPVLWVNNVLAYHTWNPYEKFAMSVRGDDKEENVQDLIADLVDMDGDGLPDRVVRPLVPDGGQFDHWLFQKNLGKEQGFADAVIWEGVDSSFGPDAKTGGSISWYNADWSSSNPMTDLAVLRDMNGDGLPDRVLTKPKNVIDSDSDLDWYVQQNTGSGFAEPVLWDSQVRSTSVLANKRWGTAINAITEVWTGRQVYTDLKDVTGDGLPDRVVVDTASSGTGFSWFVEENNGTTFLAAVEWMGIEAADLQHAAIVQDDQNFRMNVAGPVGGAHGRLPHYVEAIVDLKDINGDGFLDRILTEKGQDHWKVQFGTGKGFLPAEEMRIDSLSVKTGVKTVSHYDHVYVSLKASESITPAKGQVRVELLKEAGQEPQVLQTWTLDSLTSSWNDLLLPLNNSPETASQIRLTWVPEQGAPEVTLAVSNTSFVSLRPEASKDWLDRLLADENVLESIHSESTQTLQTLLTQQFNRQSDLSSPSNPSSPLSSPHALGGDLASLNWTQLLEAETLIHFNDAGAAGQFENLYGAVTRLENGRVVETTQPDGTVITFDGLSSEQNGGLKVQVTTPDGTSSSTVESSYGRIRSLKQTNGQILQYRYEFCGSTASASLCQGRAANTEVTVVFDSANDVTERMIDNRIVSRIEANGIETRFSYNPQGELATTALYYKNRERQSFQHESLDNGHSTVVTAEGIREEYDADGRIVAHVTVDGYRYVHRFERAQKVVTTFETQTTALADGTSLSIEVPFVTLTDDPEGEEIHRVELESYTDAAGNKISYELGSDGTSLRPRTMTLTDGTVLTVSLEMMSTNSGTQGDSESTVLPSNARVLHPDGTLHDFKNGKPFAVISAAGLAIAIHNIGNEPRECHSAEGGNACPDFPVVTESGTESSEFHYGQALKLWQNLVLPSWEQYFLPPELVTASVYDLQGQIQTREYAEGTLETYSGGRIEDVLAPEGERLIHYAYDDSGNPVAVQMEGSRRRLHSTVLRLKADVAMQRAEALHHLAEREQVVHETIEGDYLVARNWLLHLRAQIESQQSKVANVSVSGKKASSLIGAAMAQISAGIDQVNSALSKLAADHSEALESLTVQVRETNSQIEVQTIDSYLQIKAEESKAHRAILKEEMTPVVYHWHRKILGRDPSQAEYERWIDEVTTNEEGCHSGEGGNLCAQGETSLSWLADLKTELSSSVELATRTAEVNAIKARVAEKLNQYNSWSEADKEAFALSLGISVIPAQAGGAQGDLISLTTSEINTIAKWLSNQSLHFGQSAYIALESLLLQNGYTKVACDSEPQSQDTSSFGSQCAELGTDYFTNGSQTFSRIQLAAELILTDILTGTLTPLESGDLVLSLYAMKRFAARYGLSTEGYSLTYEGLKEAFVIASEAKQSQESCHSYEGGNPCSEDNARFVAHINGNHYVILTNVTDTEVTYIDPGMGPGSALQTTTLSKDEFLKVWLNSALPGSNQGVIFSSERPLSENQTHQPAVLTTQQTMRVRGAFFGFIGKIFKAAFTFVVDAVKAVVQAIKAIVIGVYESMKSFFVGLYNIFVGLFTFDFSQVWKGIKQSTFESTQKVITGFKEAYGEFEKPAFNLLSNLGVSDRTIERIKKVRQYAWDSLQIAVGVALIATGNVPQGIGFIAGGTANLLNKYTNLSPTVKSVITISTAAAAAFGAGYIDGVSLSAGLESLKLAVPTLSQEFAAAGLSGIGSAVGLDPRLTSLISLPVRAAVGSIAGNVFGNKGTVVGYRDDGSPITVSNPRDLGDFIGGAIQTAPQEISLSLPNPVADGNDPLNGFRINAPELLNNTTNTPGFFDKLVSSLKDAAISAINFLGPVAIAATPSIIASFNQAQLKNGLSQTLNENVTVVFDRPTLENIFNTPGGVDAILAQGATPVTLPDQTIVNSYKFSDTTTLLFDQNNEFIGQFRNGRYELGEFEISGGEIAIKDGKILEILGEGQRSEITIVNKQISKISYYESAVDPALVIEKTGQNPIFIKGPDNEISFTGDFNIGLGPVSLGYALGRLQRVSVSSVVNESAIPGEESLPLFALVNGIMNPEILKAPDYLLNLAQDMVNESGGRIELRDIILAPTFFSAQWLEVFQQLLTAIDIATTVATGGVGGAFAFVIDQLLGGVKEEIIKNVINFVKDTSSVLSEQWDTTRLGTAGQNVQMALERWFGRRPADRARELVGVGYSGGFPVIAEILAAQKYNQETDTGYHTVSVVGVGGATIQLQGPYRKALDMILAVGKVLAKGAAQAQIYFASIKFRDSVQEILTALVTAGPAGLGQWFTQEEIEAVHRKVVEGKMEEAYNAFMQYAQDKTQYWNAFEPAFNANSDISTVVNLYGDKDILTLLPSLMGEKIGGFRKSIGTYSVGDDFKTLINIEITGADHWDYIRAARDSRSIAGLTGEAADFIAQLLGKEQNDPWNRTVSNFVADLIGNSTNADDVEFFLSQEAFLRHGAIAEPIDGKWVVKLPGWEQNV